jgi:2-oxo-4-hydroxy-4-carboxy-5-ureidoimidazoline decarboxylase
MRTPDSQRQKPHPTAGAVLAAGLALATFGTLMAPASAAELDIGAVNKMDHAAFTEALGGIFEKSPWVADAAWEARPFATVDDLHAKMVAVVKYASIDQQLKLLRSHPDLAGKEAQAGAMTASSVAEQASAGLNALSKDEIATLAGYNAEYKKKFGFPFMIAVRNYSKLGIFNLFKQRLSNDTVSELGTALQQVYNITRIRLEKKFEA